MGVRQPLRVSAETIGASSALLKHDLRAIVNGMPLRPAGRRWIARCAAIVAVSLLDAAPAGAGTPVRVPPRRLGASAHASDAAVALSKATRADHTSSVVVLGRDDVFADNLAGAALTGTRGPMLFTTGGATATLDPAVEAEIARVLPAPAGCGGGSEIDVLGGTSAVSDAVESKLEQSGYCVQRIAGEDRVETALRVAERAPDPSTVLLARADAWPDSAAASAYAAVSGHPILLTPPSSLPASVASYLSSVTPTSIVLLGGTAALSETVESQAAKYGSVKRLAGPTRDATATAIATSLLPNARTVALVNGWAPNAWAYAIAGGVTASTLGAVELYVQPAALTSADAGQLDARDDTSTVAIGPTSLVGDTVVSAVETSRSWQRIAPAGATPLRYRDDVFTNVTTTSGVVYRNAANRSGSNVTLKLDVYEPASDTETSRPAIVWVHGGGFSSGSRTSPELADEATTFAKRGYVNISIDYRLEPEGCNASAPTGVCVEAIAEALEDAKAAVRWLRSKASTYRVDTTRIAIGGSSAGAITAVNIAYDSSEDASSAVRAAMSLSGANILGRATSGDAPVLLLHGTDDQTVPYAWAAATVDKARSLGDLAVLTTWTGAGHVPYAQFREQILREETRFLWWMLDLERKT